MASQKAYNRLMLLTLILDKIERFYVDERDPDELIGSAIQGMLAPLDQHTIFLSADEYASYQSRYNGFQGVGIKYERMGDRLLVTSVIPGGPAAERGILPGDKIIRLGGKIVEYLNADDISRLLQEPIVRLEVKRDDSAQLLSFALTKRNIPPITVPCAFMLNDSIAYVRIAHFSDRTPDELDQAFATLRTAPLKGLVLDLRDNPGGSFIAGIKVADRFIYAGRMIAYTRGRGPGANMQYFATVGNKLPSLPLVLLVNGASASDAEIVAGAIQDWDRGIIAGQPTFGKALVQTEYAFQDGSALLLTTARFYTPLGRALQKQTPLSAPTRGAAEPAPVYRTPKGRSIPGGGSIIPDVILSSPGIELTAALQPLLTSPENPLAVYADGFHRDHPEIGKNQDLFIRQFQISDDMLRDFMIHVRRSGARLTLQDFSENKPALMLLLKREIASLFWGEQARQMIDALNDPQVLESQNLFGQARALLSL